MMKVAALLLAACVLVHSQDVVLNNLCGAYGAEDLIADLLGDTQYLTITNAGAFGDCRAKGLVQLDDHDIGADFSQDDTTNAVVFTTGLLSVAVDTSNSIDSTTTNNNGVSDNDFANLVGTSSNDASFIEFDMTSAVNGELMFEYVFASEEYTEWSVNDAFALWIDGVNVATLPNGQYVGIQTVSDDVNSQYFIDNDLQTSPADLLMEWDGRTVLMSSQVLDVVAGQTYHFKLGISDAGDSSWDSAVYLKPGAYEADDLCSITAFQCAFEFSGSNGEVPVYDISATADNVGFSDRIVSKSSDLIGAVNTDGASIVTLTEVLGAKTYLNAFADNQFKAFNHWTGSESVAKIGHETFQQDSRAQASGLCVKVSLNNWQVLNADGNVQDNIQASDPATDCVVFRTA